MKVFIIRPRLRYGHFTCFPGEEFAEFEWTDVLGAESVMAPEFCFHFKTKRITKRIWLTFHESLPERERRKRG